MEGWEKGRWMEDNKGQRRDGGRGTVSVSGISPQSAICFFLKDLFLEQPKACIFFSHQHPLACHPAEFLLFVVTVLAFVSSCETVSHLVNTDRLGLC